MTKPLKKELWRKGPRNFFLEKNGVLLSYNPNVKIGREFHPLGPISDFADALSGACKEGGEETALEIDSTWYILQGDFREEYEQAFPDKKALLEIYNKYKLKYRSLSSTD